MTLSLDNRVALVTGGSSGIGRATVLKLAERGAKVAIWDINQAAGAALVAELKQQGHEALFAVVNVVESEAVNHAVASLLETWGRVDILVNNAGIVRDGQLVKYKDGAVQSVMTDAMFDQVVDVNLKGVFICTRAVVPTMIQQSYGRILNASSVVAQYGNFGQTNYVATKSGVIGMTKVWARELGKYGITVNTVTPGFILTEMVASMPEKVLDRMIAATPVGRAGQPEDIANAYAFLASDEASFISGAVLSVDGGMVIGT
jgi:3-oxoacyl-[acyl-carrier protein] reductase